MKRIDWFLIGCLSLLLLGSTACNSIIYSDLEPCHLEVSYRYDYNLLMADAFPSQVKRVDLYIFDEKGEAVGEPVRVEGNPFESNFSHTVDLAPGKYTFVAWAGRYDDSYTITDTDNLGKMMVEIKAKGGASDKELHHLWHGIVRDVEVKGIPEERVEVPLIKDTNTFRVQMVALSKGQEIKEEMNPDNYRIKIVSDNGMMNGHNRVVDGHTLSYHPYLSKYDMVNISAKESALGLTYELRTGRLMSSANNRLYVTNSATNKQLFDIDLKELIAFLRLSEYSSMPLQEYMDRQDSYVVTLVFHSGIPDKYASLSVYINGWLIRESSMVLE